MNLSLINKIDAVQTKMAVTGGIEGLISGGVIQIESEKIRYGCASNDEFLRLTRGIEGTSPASHEAGAIVTLVAIDPNVDVKLSNDVVMFEGPLVPVDGVVGSDVSEIGSLYIDRVSGKLYINGGTKALPVWKLVTSAA
jgi:hypothetical protein